MSRPRPALERLSTDVAIRSVADSLTRTRGPVAAEALRAYASLRREGAEAGRERASRVLSRLPGADPGASIQSFLRYETARALVEAGRAEAALPWLRSFDYYDDVPFPYTTLVAFQLGRAYEAIGRAEDARYHYARFLQWLEEPDPELHPLRERAREALARLLEAVE